MCQLWLSSRARDVTKKDIDLVATRATICGVARSFCTSLLLLSFAAWAEAQIANGQVPGPSRFNYHSAPQGAGPQTRDQHLYKIPSLLEPGDGPALETAADWYQRRRAQLTRNWTAILGKLGPAETDLQWFGDIADVVVHDQEEKEHYTRIHLSLPIERDFYQPHLLLLPKNQGEGPFPAVILWTSTTPDYRKPEEWWGAWLASRGYVVLTGWSFIRNYRESKSYRDRVNECVYERFGHWLPMAKMVHDVQREHAYLKTLATVDSSRVGFMGFSLSAKAALYVAAFAPEITATVAIDPHLAIHGDTNYHDPWYLDWNRKFASIETSAYPDPERRGTVFSLLDADPFRPGLERNHHELMALCAPRAFMLIGCSMDKERSSHSDNLQSWGYFNRAREVYRFLGLGDRLQFVTHEDGHRATHPKSDQAWQQFFEQWLKATPIRIEGRARP